jgi:hypothetical protein
MTTSEGYVTMDDGVRLYFQKTGTGPKTIAIPNGVHLLDDLQRLANGRALIFYDVRNRGLSDPVSDSSKLSRGVHQDVEDLDAVRRHFGFNQIDLIGHFETTRLKAAPRPLVSWALGPSAPERCSVGGPHSKTASASPCNDPAG